jgi:hypothetical protein
MRKNLSVILPTFALATFCAAQTIGPPPDCSIASLKATSSKRSLAGVAPGCPPEPITGLGTAGVVPVFKAPATLGDSVISQSASGKIGVGGLNTGSAMLSVTGGIAATGALTVTGAATAGTVTAGAITATGALNANTVASTGSVTGSDFTATGAVKAASVTTSGNIAGNTVSATGNITASSLTASGNITTASGSVSALQYNVGSERVLSTLGNANTFAGVGAGRTNGGINNSYFGSNAGEFGFAGSGNSAVGAEAGLNNGFNENSFFGHAAGRDFSGGNNNTLLGAHTQATSGLQNATAIGSNASVTQSNTLVLGGVSGVNNGTSVDVGIGTTAPPSRLTVAGGDIYVANPGTGLILRTTNPFLCGRLVVSAQGQVSATMISCPGEVAQ